MGERLIVAGGRDITDRPAVERAILSSGFKVDEVVCGKARGVDTVGEDWAKRMGIPVKSFPAKWEYLGNAAGPVRNKAMAKYATALVAVWDGVSSGTYNMICNACSQGISVFVYIYPQPIKGRKTPVDLLRAAMIHELRPSWWSFRGWSSVAVAVTLEAIRQSIELPEAFTLNDIIEACSDAFEGCEI